MTWLTDLLANLFPYRRHMEEEIEYLKGQLSQRDRRIVELQDKLLTQPKPVERREPVAATLKKPRGWDEYRSTRKSEESSEEASEAAQAQDVEGVPV